MKKITNFIIKVSISIGLLIFLFSRIDFRRTIFYIRTIEPFYYISAVLLFLFITILAMFRWMLILRVYNKNLSFWRILVANCGGLFFNVFLPSTIGGDITRIVDLSLHTKDGSSIFTSVFLDRIFGFTGLMLVAVFGFSYGYCFGLIKDLRLFLFIMVFTLLVALFLFFMFNKKMFNLVNKIVLFKFLRRYLDKFHDSCYPFRSQRKTIFYAILLSVIIQGSFSIVFYFTGVSLGINLNLVNYLVIVSIITIITFLPISIGGLGIRDNAAVVLFSALGVASDKIVAMSLLVFTLYIIAAILGGLVYAVALYGRRL